MQSLREIIADAERTHRAVGHFNISNSEGFSAVLRAAGALHAPVIIGVSEGERDFIGIAEVAALVRDARERRGLPVFLNADHSYSVERVREAAAAGFDAAIFDGAKLSLDENIAEMKKSVAAARAAHPDILMEGEIGFIGVSSRLLDEVPAGAEPVAAHLTKPADAARFVRETGVDLLAPAVGNLHGMLKTGGNPALDIARVREVRAAAGVPLVLHGGSGIADADIAAAIVAGIALVHVNTELRVAFRTALARGLQEDPDEIAPYKYLKPAVAAMQKIVEEKLRLFGWT